jgi:hypothetical protein
MQALLADELLQREIVLPLRQFHFEPWVMALGQHWWWFHRPPNDASGFYTCGKAPPQEMAKRSWRWLEA